MNLKKEFSEYRDTYNTYVDALKKESEIAEEKRKQIIEKDKEDIAIQNDSKEKHSMVEEYMFQVYKINLIQSDLQKISQRLLYINEASIRTSFNLELSEEDSKFIKALAMENQTSYVIDSNGNLSSKVAGLDEIIKKRVSERKDMIHSYLAEIRKSNGI